jgi:DNA-binding transcriptional LysR family regulator
MSLHLDLVDIKLFANIAEANNLTRGADRTHISLPAASTRIKHLEESLGTKLLYRNSHGVTLTPPGQALLHHARLVLQQLDSLRVDMHDYTKGLKGHVRIHANTTAITEFLPAVLPTYLANHPDVSVDLKERMSHDIVHSVSEGKIDVGIVAGNVRTGSLQVLPYRRDRLVLATAITHPLARKNSIHFMKTLDYVHVGLGEESAIHNFLAQVANQLHRKIQVRIQVGNFEAVCRMIEANVGIGILPESAAIRHARTMAIRIVRLEDDWALRDLHVCVRDLKLLPSFTRELVELLAAECVENENAEEQAMMS